ncbi:Helix-turn-helix domain-containing protein [Succinivibrio dextrinosolvens DSM 3072]|uniref:Helix-turn-helix domain-containing protein n=2 Tax=Succinivibrio dextrinosolvens DSM 3072 TaxID=1123324 RepID=A0A1T4W312_9GAMM|nr:helix-turn-helix domain-containing protein [Succinivibrio dextrinosolvens]SKA71455.1 Helix-turn-helix domain-containing protein [Succinivibrio dextrinosolvens DSM 3072]
MKLTYEQRLLVAEDYFRIGASCTANKWGLNRDYVRELSRLLENNSLQDHSKYNIYTSDFKITVVKAYVNGEGSFRDIATRYGIPDKKSVRTWYHIYQTNGEEGLRNMKKNGRPRKEAVKDNKNKVNLDNLLSSDKEDYTKEEIKALKEELLRLRCHEEFSKKFEALAQDYLRKKNNK